MSDIRIKNGGSSGTPEWSLAVENSHVEVATTENGGFHHERASVATDRFPPKADNIAGLKWDYTIEGLKESLTWKNAAGFATGLAVFAGATVLLIGACMIFAPAAVPIAGVAISGFLAAGITWHLSDRFSMGNLLIEDGLTHRSPYLIGKGLRTWSSGAVDAAWIGATAGIFRGARYIRPAIARGRSFYTRRWPAVILPDKQVLRGGIAKRPPAPVTMDMRFVDGRWVPVFDTPSAPAAALSHYNPSVIPAKVYLPVGMAGIQFSYPSPTVFFSAADSASLRSAAGLVMTTSPVQLSGIAGASVTLRPVGITANDFTTSVQRFELTTKGRTVGTVEVDTKFGLVSRLDVTINNSKVDPNSLVPLLTRYFGVEDRLTSVDNRAPVDMAFLPSKNPPTGRYDTVEVAAGPSVRPLNKAGSDGKEKMMADSSRSDELLTDRIVRNIYFWSLRHGRVGGDNLKAITLDALIRLGPVNQFELIPYLKTRYNLNLISRLFRLLAVVRELEKAGLITVKKGQGIRIVHSIRDVHKAEQWLLKYKYHHKSEAKALGLIEETQPVRQSRIELEKLMSRKRTVRTFTGSILESSTDPEVLKSAERLMGKLNTKGVITEKGVRSLEKQLRVLHEMHELSLRAVTSTGTAVDRASFQRGAFDKPALMSREEAAPLIEEMEMLATELWRDTRFGERDALKRVQTHLGSWRNGTNGVPENALREDLANLQRWKAELDKMPAKYEETAVLPTEPAGDAEPAEVSGQRINWRQFPPTLEYNEAARILKKNGFIIREGGRASHVVVTHPRYRELRYLHNHHNSTVLTPSERAGKVRSALKELVRRGEEVEW